MLKNVEGGDGVDAIYLDISKALDNEEHGVLPHKLKEFGISGKLAAGLQLFLTL